MPEPRRLPTPRASLDAAGYRAGGEAIRRWIRAGDVYQVNLSRRLSWPRLRRPELRALFGRITAAAGAPFDAYLEGPQRTVISNSPERFLHVAAGQVETCPIKGTRPRGRTPIEDRWQAKALRGSAKDAAEHLMIVDLERNDLGRVCELGSVRVQELAALRSFPTVHHLVSSVQGRLRRDVDLETLLAATFPGGSITGAPKLRAMQIIDALEPVPRDVYTGAIGYLDAAGGMDWSIAIRTAIARDDGLHLHVGGGIVAASDPEAELRETRDKARAFADLWGWDA
jgi:para-aminobenzoate synthetase component 1